VNAVRWKTATFAGHQLRYAVTGSGPAVVLPKKDRGSYLPFERLADQYTMVQIEPLGFGRSDRPDPYPPVGIHEQILAVCDQEDIPEFAVWGFSQGGAMACVIAQATPRARLMVCGGFNVLRGLSDAWLARMNRERRVPVGSRTFWHWFHSYNWHAELRRMAVPKLMYWGTLDAQRVARKDQHVLRGLGIEVAEFTGLDHGGCGLGDPESPATDMVANWLQRHGW
jgi:hypothetical protein